MVVVKCREYFFCMEKCHEYHDLLYMECQIEIMRVVDGGELPGVVNVLKHAALTVPATWAIRDF